MIQEKDRLDLAIDQVANKMVSVPENDQMLDTIISGLPERSAGGWLGGYRLQFVGGAIALLAIAILSFDTIVRHERSTQPFGTGVPNVRAEQPSRTIVPNDRAERTSRTVVSNVRTERSRRTSVPNDTFDRDFGLAPLAAPVAIGIEALAAESPIVIPASEMAPLVMSNLSSLDDSRD